MVDATITTEFNAAPIVEAEKKAAFANFNHAAASISKDAKASIEKSAFASAPGTPPHTKRNLLRRAIRFLADEFGAVIGPMASIAGQVGSAHEFGGEYKGQDYPERPFMEPAMERAMGRFAGSWEGSIGG